jgi:hypothetical protein
MCLQWQQRKATAVAAAAAKRSARAHDDDQPMRFPFLHYTTAIVPPPLDE